MFRSLKLKRKIEVVESSGKGWLQLVKRGARIALKASAVLLAAPVKLPLKLLVALKYLAVIAGILQATDRKEDE